MRSDATPDEPGLPRGLLAVATLIFLVLGALASIAAAGLRTNNAIENWLDPEDPATRDYERFRETFGADEFVVVALSGKPLFEPAALDAMLRAQAMLEEAPAVRRAAGIPAVYRDLFGGEDPDALREELISTPFYRGVFISPDETVAGLFLEIDPPKDSAERRAMLDRIEQAAAPLREHGFRVDLVGPPTLNVALDEVSQRETLRAMPIALGCTVIILLALLRNVRATAIACVCAWLSVAIPLGLMDVMGYSLTMVSAVLPPLLWSLSLAHTVHFVTHYYRQRSQGCGLTDAIAVAWREVRLPCALAAFTTSAGFLSFVFSTMPPIREMGVFAAIAIVVSMLVNLSVGPTLALLLRIPERQRAKRAWAPLLVRAERVAEQRPWLVASAFAVIGISGMVSATQLHPEPNPLTFLPRSAPAVQSYEFVSEHLTGLYTLECVLECPDGWLDPECWDDIDTVQRAMEGVDYVARAMSPLDLLRKMNQWDNDFDPKAYKLPATREQAQRLINEMPDWARIELARLASSDGRRVRVSVLVKAMDAERFYALAERAQRTFASLENGMSGHLTGIVWLLNNAQVQLALTQVKSFAFSFLVVFAVIGLGLRSLKLMALAMPPTLAPTLTAFAAMPALGIPLDAATVLVAGVALGMADDNTIHFIASYRLMRRPGESVRDALTDVLREVGPAIIYSTGTTSVGFFTLCASGFIPIRYFGLLSGIALVTALAANLLLTPALIVLITRRRKGPESSEL